MGLNEAKRTQKTLNIVQMIPNELKMCLNELKWAEKSLNDLKWAAMSSNFQKILTSDVY